MSPCLSLLPLSASDYAEVSDIQVAPEQIKFAGTVSEAFETAEHNVDFHGIFQNGKAVGFFKIDRSYADKYPFAKTSEIGLRAYIVDQRLQGQGIGTAAIRVMPDYFRGHYPWATAVVLSVNCVNTAAIQCYLKGGFVDTGEIWPHGDAGPQYVMRLPLPKHEQEVTVPHPATN